MFNTVVMEKKEASMLLLALALNSLFALLAALSKSHRALPAKSNTSNAFVYKQM